MESAVAMADKWEGWLCVRGLIGGHILPRIVVPPTPKLCTQVTEIQFALWSICSRAPKKFFFLFANAGKVQKLQAMFISDFISKLLGRKHKHFDMCREKTSWTFIFGIFTTWYFFNVQNITLLFYFVWKFSNTLQTLTWTSRKIEFLNLLFIQEQMLPRAKAPYLIANIGAVKVRDETSPIMRSRSISKKPPQHDGKENVYILTICRIHEKGGMRNKMWYCSWLIMCIGCDDNASLEVIQVLNMVAVRLYLNVSKKQKICLIFVTVFE